MALELKFDLQVTRRGGPTVRDVPAPVFIKTLAQHLKSAKKVEPPSNVNVIKTGVSKELSPYDADWYYVRAAAVARKVYLFPGIGVGALRRVFGGRNRRTKNNTEFFENGAGGVIRRILKQLEDANYLGKKANKKGRFIKSNGQKELDTIAKSIIGKKA